MREVQKMENFIPVLAKFDEEGCIMPVSIEWKGRQIPIDKVTDCRPAASLKHGGQGLRYTCRIHNKTVYLFMDEGHWFIEQI